MSKQPGYRVPPLSEREQELVNTINETWSKDQALAELRSHLQTAVEVELATIPVYLYTYYSLDRTPEQFPKTELSRWADYAGALLMSVPVEEMLHMSLAANVLYAVGGEPQLYRRSPGPYPTNLPGHARRGPDRKPLRIPLAKLSFEHLWSFLEIEYPSATDAPPEGSRWQTIGQLYSYVRCIIESDLITDDDFGGRDEGHQIQPTNYSPNNIDTAWAKAPFDNQQPVPAGAEGSAADVAEFANAGDAHLGPHALLTVTTKHRALQAIATICFEGEGFDHTRYDDRRDVELSHYYKFLRVQSKLQGYPDEDDENDLPQQPEPPQQPERQWSPAELATIVFAVPDNPVSSQFSPGRKAVADLLSGLYQYMLIMTETIFRVPTQEQKVYFNRSMHMSMIWILDKLLRATRTVPLHSDNVVTRPDGAPRLACPFDNIDLGARDVAFSTLKTMAEGVHKTCGNASWYQEAGLDYYVQQIEHLPDVSPYWKGSKYAGAPRFPHQPPAQIPGGGPRHACMGLNSCRNQGRTLDNACAGQGYCSTALRYDMTNPQQGEVSDHTCHVLNDCAGQGGCGLYGTAEEQSEPGHNACRSLGSCATPINAERFSTDGKNQGKSVWVRARKVFEDKVWPKLREKDPDLPAEPPQVPGPPGDPDLFKYGPTIEWIEDYSGGGMTACGSSGLSGAGSCA